MSGSKELIEVRSVQVWRNIAKCVYGWLLLFVHCSTLRSSTSISICCYLCLKVLPQGRPQCNCLTWPQSPVTQRAGGQRPKLQRMRVEGLLSCGQYADDNVLERSLLLHRTIRCLNPEPHLGVHWEETNINEQRQSKDRGKFQECFLK